MENTNDAKIVQVALDMLPEEEEAVTQYPEYWAQPFLDYIYRGTPPGGFVASCIANEFANAATGADLCNRKVLHKIAAMLENFFPMVAWGDRGKLMAWINNHPRNSRNSGSASSKSRTQP